MNSGPSPLFLFAAAFLVSRIPCRTERSLPVDNSAPPGPGSVPPPPAESAGTSTAGATPAILKLSLELSDGSRIVGTRDSLTVELYVDGKCEDQSSWAEQLTATSDTLHIGFHPGYGFSTCFCGLIEKVMSFG